MLDLSPDITPPQPVRLADYRPPAFLIDTVDLAFDLGAHDTRVKSRLVIRRNLEAGERAAALELDGEELELISVALDGAALGPNRYRLSPEGGLILADMPDAFTLDIETRINPESNTALSGLYVSGGNFCTQCEAEGFRRITFFPDRVLESIDADSCRRAIERALDRDRPDAVGIVGYVRPESMAAARWSSPAPT